MGPGWCLLVMVHPILIDFVGHALCQDWWTANTTAMKAVRDRSQSLCYKPRQYWLETLLDNFWVQASSYKIIWIPMVLTYNFGLSKQKQAESFGDHPKKSFLDPKPCQLDEICKFVSNQIRPGRQVLNNCFFLFLFLIFSRFSIFSFVY